MLAVLVLLAMLQPGRADQAQYEVTIIIQTGLNQTGDYNGSIDGMCGVDTADAANHYMIRKGELTASEKVETNEFCENLPAYYFAVFKGKEPFAIENQLGFETVSRSEVERLFKSCGRQTPDDDLDFFADGSKAAMFGVFELILETPTDEKDDESYRCMLRQGR
ncbi:hypothetical protein ASD50_12880 [Mesorhizobium sp. Root552]|nr:hypothetical protein ASD50_12880 [Mesorhizobium sp. Root552]